MAAFRGVHVQCSFYLFLINCLFLKSILAVDGSNSKCNRPWLMSVNEELLISWSGDDRDSTVIANISTNDTYGRNCDSNVSLKENFKSRLIKVGNPCSNAFYSVTLGLMCDLKTQRKTMIMRTPPDAPSIIDLIPTNSSVGVKWSSPPGKVQLYKATLKGGRRYKIMTEETKSQFWNFTDLEPYTNYSATVSAQNEDHWGKTSPAKTISTLEGVPFEPKNLRATSTTEKISLMWNDPEPETGPISVYHISWTEEDTAHPSTSISNVTSFEIEELYSYTTYFIEVAAINSVGIGPPANLNQSTKLAVPDPPVIKIKEVTNESITVEWELSNFYRGPDPEYSLRWKLQRQEDKYDSIDLSGVSKQDQYTIKKLKPFSAYGVQIRARNEAGFGSWSKIVKADTLTGVPSIPTNLKVLSQSATHVFISWDIPVPTNGVIGQYMVHWKTKLKNHQTDYTNDTSFNATDLSPFTEYDFKICAETKVGWGNWSAVLKVKTDISVPSEPLNLTESGVTNSTISIKWLPSIHKNGPQVNYVIRWMKSDVNPDDYEFDNDSDNSTVMSSNSWNYEEVNTTSNEIRNLDSYVNYSVQVCGKTSAGLGNYTDPLVIQTLPGIPSSPVRVRVIVVKSTSLVFQWFIPEFTNGPLEGYVVHWGVKATDGSLVRTQKTSYEGLGLRPYTEYFFMVAAQTLGGGQGSFSTIYQRTSVSKPSSPRHLIASSITDNCILLQWTHPEHPNGPFVQYTIKWRQLIEESATQVQDTNSTSYRIRNLLSETSYSIKVRASTEAGEGPWSEVLFTQTLKKDHSSAIIAGSVVGSFIILFIIAGVVLLFLVKKKGGLKHILSSKPEINSTETSQTAISVPLENIKGSEKITVRNFDEHVLNLMTNGYYKLAQEFERLGRESPGFPSNEAKKNDNLTKNRWVKILPFDYSRVKLRPVGDEVEPDFINASYIPGDSHMMDYIATQGPLPNTVNDFWKMVWQESVFLMVMLTQCVERAKRTCERYWPSSGTANQYGDIEVHSVSESITPAYIHRLFLLTKDGKQRHIVHLHYMNWPVSGCPKSPEDFLSFVRTVREQVSCGVTGPMLVHCSAGIGRTGTFIAVDRMLQQLTKKCDEIDVYDTVLEIRRYRANLVQTEEQYYFIHLCIQRIIQENKQESEDDYGGGIYSN